LRFCFRSIQV